MANKTKYLIIDSFLSLVKENDLEKISVTDIVENCDISRQTFYYHFDGINEMIRWAFEQETEKICKEGPSSSSWVKSCADYLPFMNKYNDLFQKSINTSLSTYINGLLQESTYKFSCAYITKYKKININSKMEFLLKCTSLAFVGLLHEEFKKEKPEYNTLMKQIENAFEKEL